MRQRRARLLHCSCRMVRKLRRSRYVEASARFTRVGERFCCSCCTNSSRGRAAHRHRRHRRKKNRRLQHRLLLLHHRRQRNRLLRPAVSEGFAFVSFRLTFVGPAPTTAPPQKPPPAQPLKSVPSSSVQPISAATGAQQPVTAGGGPASVPIPTGVKAELAITGDRTDTRVKMNRMRQRIAGRLKEAQNTYAMLTTFNEIDMRYGTLLVACSFLSSYGCAQSKL